MSYTGPSVDIGHGDLRVSDNRRFLQHADGTPFFYLGDTAWELFHKLNREEADLYLRNRAERGYTAIQAVGLGEVDGVEAPNAHGRWPLKKNTRGIHDPTLPDLDGDYTLAWRLMPPVTKPAGFSPRFGTDARAEVELGHGGNRCTKNDGQACWVLVLKRL